MILKTPIYDLSKYPQVYEPSEDSFLFLDALEKEIGFLQSLKPQFAVEIGSGSGIIITALSLILNDCLYFATDINPEACIASAKTAQLNGVAINCLNMDLLCNFKNNLFDVILFNPPYVLTDPSEVYGNGLNRAWAGGLNGREIIDKLLLSLQNLLTKSGVCYMVLLKQNKIDEIKSVMYGNRFRTEIVLERKICGEHLYVAKFSRF